MNVIIYSVKEYDDEQDAETMLDDVEEAEDEVEGSIASTSNYSGSPRNATVLVNFFKDAEITELLKLFFDMMTDKHALVREHIVKKVLSEAKSSILKKRIITQKF